MPDLPHREIPIQCAGCGQQLVVDEQILEQPLECTQCHTPIDISSYDVLIELRKEQKELIKQEKQRVRLAQQQARSAEREKIDLARRAKRQQNEEAKRRKMAEREAWRQAHAGRKKQELDSQREKVIPNDDIYDPSVWSRPPRYRTIHVLATTMQVVGVLIWAATLACLILAVLIFSNESGRGQSAGWSMLGMTAGLGMIGLFHFAFGTLLHAFRAATINVWLMRADIHSMIAQPSAFSSAVNLDQPSDPFVTNIPQSGEAQN